jgi:magnesium-protoporphyrin O-methyltransferase
MGTARYEQRRSEIETYFDRTAAAAWSALTSTDPVGRIRQTVRAGRDRMRQTLLDCLPADLSGMRLLDAGCGTGALAVEAARRGANVVAIDLSPTLVELARERLPSDIDGATIEFRVGDMSAPDLGRFDYAVAMDSLIHYDTTDAVSAVARIAARVDRGIAFTFAPWNPLLGVMHAAGRAFPRANRAPSIVPVAERALWKALDEHPDLRDWSRGRSERIKSGFYTSQACELRHR